MHNSDFIEIKIYHYEIYKMGSSIYLDIPAQNLETITFSLDKDILNIFIHNEYKVLKVYHLTHQIIENIQAGLCYIRELVSTNHIRTCHLIKIEQ